MGAEGADLLETPSGKIWYSSFLCGMNSNHCEIVYTEY